MKTTRRDFRVFKKTARKMLELYGLSDWVPYFYWEKMEGAIARVECDQPNRICHISLGKNMNANGGRDRRKLVIGCAIHEVHHVLVQDLVYRAYTRFVPSQEDIDKTEHALVRRLDRFVKKYTRATE